MKKISQNEQIIIEPDAISSVKILDKKSREKVKIPTDPLNPQDNVVPVQINGYKWICKKGEYLSLPKECIKLLEEAGYLD
ncbi:MAG: hypothetical protein IJW82_05975 [Clostridia bacterium]|nr:hypothetical protein [Clostridia bacterium]